MQRFFNRGKSLYQNSRRTEKEVSIHVSVNEREIEFAEQTAERGFETGEAMQEYLKKLISVVLGYIEAAKIPGKQDVNNIGCRANVGKWGFWIRAPEGRYPRLRLYYQHKQLARISFGEVRTKKTISKSESEEHIKYEKKLDIDVEYLDNKNLFYITGFIEAVDQYLTEMNAMVSKVIYK
jgi:hypothetical protein